VETSHSGNLNQLQLSFNDLVFIFAELTTAPTSGQYQDVTFSTVNVRPSRFDDRTKQGIHLRVQLPRPLSLDLHLENQVIGSDVPLVEEGGLYRDTPLDTLTEHLQHVFDCSATEPGLVFERLLVRPAQVLLSMARHYHIVMNDESIQYGPIVRQPQLEAEALDALVKAVNLISTGPTPFGRCPACRAEVQDGTNACPSCGLALS
jgi:hypothetical protein